MALTINDTAPDLTAQTTEGEHPVTPEQHEVPGTTQGTAGDERLPRAKVTLATLSEMKAAKEPVAWLTATTIPLRG